MPLPVEEPPIKQQYKLYFWCQHQCVSSTSFEYYDLLEKLPKDIDIEDFEIAYSDLNLGSLHKHRIGGYPSFCQYDPRHEEDNNKDKDIVLLQISSIGSINWIDEGVASFLISREKLKKLDFSEVMYNMDFY